MRVRLDVKDSTGAMRPVGQADMDPHLLGELRARRGPDERTTEFLLNGETCHATWRGANEIAAVLVPSREAAKRWPGFRPAPGVS